MITSASHDPFMTYQARLDTAKRRVAELRAIVLVQEKMAASMDVADAATAAAMLALTRMRRTLEIFEREYEAAMLEGNQSARG